MATRQTFSPSPVDDADYLGGKADIDQPLLTISFYEYTANLRARAHCWGREWPIRWLYLVLLYTITA